MEMSATIGNLAAALCAAQAEMKGAFKDAKNPHFRNQYATLESVINTARPALTSHGIAWVQAPGALVDGAITVTTVLMHKSGEWVSSSFQMPLSKRDPQATGSACTYACRYALMAMLGLPPTDDMPRDDDGEAAHGRGASPPLPPPPPAPPPPPSRPADPAAEDKIVETLVRAMAMCAEERDLKKWAGDNKPVIDGLSTEGRERISKAYMRTRDEMRSAA